MSSPKPETLTTLARAYADRLGLADWDVRAAFTEEFSTATQYGDCQSNDQWRYAQIRIAADTPEDMVPVVLGHEVGHIVVREIMGIVGFALGALPEKVGLAYLGPLEEAEERLVTRIGEALAGNRTFVPDGEEAAKLWPSWV